MTDERPEQKLIADLSPEEAAEEMRLREQLRDLAELRELGERIGHVSRLQHDGRLRIRLTDGEIVHVEADVVDAYLEHRRAPR